MDNASFERPLPPSVCSYLERRSRLERRVFVFPGAIAAVGLALVGARLLGPGTSPTLFMFGVFFALGGVVIAAFIALARPAARDLRDGRVLEVAGPLRLLWQAGEDSDLYSVEVPGRRLPLAVGEEDMARLAGDLGTSWPKPGVGWIRRVGSSRSADAWATVAYLGGSGTVLEVRDRGGAAVYRHGAYEVGLGEGR
jgi:hypothetical protein